MDGVVEIRPRSMCLLRKPTKKTILSAIDVRELLEVYCVKAIIRRSKDPGFRNCEK
jgi:DNA-binding GntR family transcriptional regulator